MHVGVEREMNANRAPSSDCASVASALWFVSDTEEGEVVNFFFFVHFRFYPGIPWKHQSTYFYNRLMMASRHAEISLVSHYGPNYD